MHITLRLQLRVLLFLTVLLLFSFQVMATEVHCNNLDRGMNRFGFAIDGVPFEEQFYAKEGDYCSGDVLYEHRCSEESGTQDIYPPGWGPGGTPVYDDYWIEIDCSMFDTDQVQFHCVQYAFEKMQIGTGAIREAIAARCEPNVAACIDTEVGRDPTFPGTVTGYAPATTAYSQGVTTGTLFTNQQDFCGGVQNDNLMELSCDDEYISPVPSAWRVVSGQDVPPTGMVNASHHYSEAQQGYVLEPDSCLGISDFYGACQDGACTYFGDRCVDMDSGHVYGTKATAMGIVISPAQQMEDEEPLDDWTAATDTFVYYHYKGSIDNTYMTEVTDENNHTTTSYTDRAGNLVKVRDALGNVWSYQYDLMNRLIRILPPENAAQTTYSYEPRGLLWREHDPEKEVFNADEGYTDTDAYEYDANGRLITYTTKLGVKQFSYDTLNRIVQVMFDRDNQGYGDPNGPDPNLVVLRYYYDGDDTGKLCLNNNQYSVGKLCAVIRYAYHNTSPAIDIVQYARSFGYDPRGRIISEYITIRNPDNSYSTHNISYTYNGIDKVIEEVVDGQETYTYAYNDRGLLDTVQLDGSYLAAFTYTPSGAVRDIWYGNEIVTNYTYTPRQWLRTIDIAGSQNLFSRYYVYDKVGNMLTMKAGPDQHDPLLATYTYDPLYRLTEVIDHEYYGNSYVFTYDALGNRLTENLVGQYTRTFTYATAENNQLISLQQGLHLDSLTEFAYDAAGSLITMTGGNMPTQYTYDPYDNMLIAADLQQDGSADMTFTYDDQGRRITKQESDGYSTYLYDAFGNTVLVDTLRWL
ncbi:MAG: hypothetical protein V1725_00555 [archaeon]